MSIQFCDYCNQYIDTEKNAEHFEECDAKPFDLMKKADDLIFSSIKNLTLDKH